MAFPIVGVGASAGGLEAVTQLLRHLPGDARMAFVLVHHLDPGQPSALVSILSRTTRMNVVEAKNGMRVERDYVYVIPPNKSLGISKGILRLSPRRLAAEPHAPVGCLTFDAHGCIREINTAAAALLGVTRACVIGKPFVVYVAKADRKKFLDHLWKVRRATSTVTTDLRLAARNGKVIQTQITTGRHQDAEGRSSLFLCTIEDATALRAAGVNTACLASIVESSQDGIISYSPDGFIQSWNHGAQKLLGYSPQEIIGRHISVIVPDEQRAEFGRNLRGAKSGATVAPHETLRRHKDGSLVAMELTLSPVMDGSKVIAVTAIGRDISERKRAEAALHASEALRQLVMDLVPVDIFAKDAHGRFF